jgi:hypothetical protein
MIMSHMRILFLAVCLAIPLPASTQVHERQFESMGGVGLGMFRPSGSDGDVAKTSPTLQLLAGFGFSNHMGAEIEMTYLPILLKSKTLASSPFKKSWQLSAVAGVRLTTGRLDKGAESAVGYLSMRTGFARIVTHTNTDIPAGSWIGRSIDKLENPGFGNFRITYKQKAFVLSPKLGSLVRLSGNSAVDISFHPMFIFDRGNVSRQYYVTIGYVLSAWQSL